MRVTFWDNGQLRIEKAGKIIAQEGVDLPNYTLPGRDSNCVIFKCGVKILPTWEP